MRLSRARVFQAAALASQFRSADPLHRRWTVLQHHAREQVSRQRRSDAADAGGQRRIEAYWLDAPSIGFVFGRITRFHHMIVPVTASSGKLSARTNQSILTGVPPNDPT